MKKQIVLLCIPFLLIACSKQEQNVSQASSAVSYYEMNEHFIDQPWSETVTNTLKEDEVDVPLYDIHTPLQYAYINSDFNSIKSFASGKSELSKPVPITLNASEIEDASTYYFEISESGDFAKPLLLTSETKEVAVKNLKIGTRYYYRYATSHNDLKKAQTHEFKTSDTLIRNIDIDGVTNVRDIGGHKSQLGGKIRQGLYYRGGRLNWTDETTTIDQASTFKRELTEDGYDTMVYDLGIKNEIDLRMNESYYTGTLAHEYGLITNETFPDIEYKPFPLNYKSDNMMLTEQDTICDIFKLLAKEESYPVYLHCNIGTDRTGMITMLLGCLLGMTMEDIYRDYLFSNFGATNNSRDISKVRDKYLKTLQGYGEENLHFAAKEYLLDCGLTNKEINNIINIHLDLRIEE